MKFTRDSRIRITQLQQRLRGAGDIANAVANELRDSLLSVAELARAIEREDAGSSLESRTRLRRIARAASQMQRAVDDSVVLAFGDAMDVEKRDLQLDDVVRRVLREIRPGYPATRVTSSELPIIHADRAVVRHVLVNVIANAFEFSALVPEPQVEISIDTQGALQVVDNGIGFPKAEAEKLFEPFARLTHDPAYPGLGLGLAAARRRLDRHGGWIRAESREGGPTRVTISFED